MIFIDLFKEYNLIEERKFIRYNHFEESQNEKAEKFTLAYWNL